MLVKRLVTLQFCWDKADKLQVMFISLKSNRITKRYFISFCKIPRTFERVSSSNFRKQGFLSTLNSRTIFEHDLLSSEVSQNLQHKTFDFLRLHLEVRKCQDITHLKGFYNLDKTLDSEFHYLKCFVIKYFRNQAQFFHLFGFFSTLCSLNGLQTIGTVETMNFRIPYFIKILQPPLGQ